MKNIIYIIVIVVCIALAIVIFVKTQSRGTGGLDSIKRGQELYWVKCNNPKCKAEYQMDMRDYFEQIEEKTRANPLSSQTPPLKCEKCGEASIYRAYKCEKCGIVFFAGRVPNDFEDRCSECGYSKIEADRKARAAQRRGQ